MWYSSLSFLYKLVFLLLCSRTVIERSDKLWPGIFELNNPQILWILVFVANPWSKHIHILVCSILLHLNIFVKKLGKFLGIKYILTFLWTHFMYDLPYDDHSWPIWTTFNQFESNLTSFSKDTQIAMKNVIINWPAYFEHIQLVSFLLPNIFGYLLCHFLGIKEIHICLVKC